MSGSIFSDRAEYEWEKLDFDLQKFIKERSLIAYLQCNNSVWSRFSIRRRNDLLQFFGTLGLDLSKAEERGYDDPDWMVEVCMFLLGIGADINHCDHPHSSPLYQAISLGVPESFVEFLLDNQADYSSNLVELLIEACTRSSNEKLVKVLMRRCINLESEVRTGEVIMSVLLLPVEELICISRFEFEALVTAGTMMDTIEYQKSVEVKIYECLGCIASYLRKESSVTWNYWKKAVEIRAAHNVTDCSLPYNDVIMFNEVIEEDSWSKLLHLYFLIVGNMVKRFTYDQCHGLMFDGLFAVTDKYYGSSMKQTELLFSIAQIVLKIYLENWGFQKEHQPSFMMDLIILCEFLIIDDKEKELALAAEFIGDIVAKELTVESNKCTVLHYAIEYSDECENENLVKSCLEMTRIMLEAGIDQRIRNRNGLTAYQLFFRIGWEHFQPFSNLFLDVFIEHGAHIDERIIDGTDSPRVCDYLKSKNADFDEGKYVSLRCLAARAIVDHNINYSVMRLPKSIKEFIKIHE